MSRRTFGFNAEPVNAQKGNFFAGEELRVLIRMRSPGRMLNFERWEDPINPLLISPSRGGETGSEMTLHGPINFDRSIRSTPVLSNKKCWGASRCVPVWWDMTRREVMPLPRFSSRENLT